MLNVICSVFLLDLILIICDRSLESIHQKEVDSNKLLRLQLSTAQAMAHEADEARDIVAVLRRKVNELQNVQNVINGDIFLFSYK